MSFGLYSAGFVIVIAGLIYGAHLMHMPTHWIVVGAVVLLGVGILVRCEGDKTERFRGIATLPCAFHSHHRQSSTPGRQG